MRDRLQTLQSSLMLMALMFIAPVCLAQEYEYADFMEDNVFYKILEDSTTVEVCFQNSFGALYIYSYSGDVVIPSNVTHNGKTYEVIGIDGGAFYMCDITSLSIPNSLQYIEAGADYQSWAPGGSYTSFVETFQGCSYFNKVIINDLAAWCNIDFGTNPLQAAHHLYLNDSEITDLVLPNTLSVIQENAFNGCTGLTSVTIPSSITSINAGAFNECSNLTKVNISSIESWCQISFSSERSNPLYYAQHLYLNGEEVTDLIIPTTVTSIGSYAFSGYYSLNSVRIPSSVTSIGYGAFNNCSALTDLTIDNGLKTIENSAFESCTALNRVLIPNSVTSIGNSAFKGCISLNELSIGNSVSTIGNNAFENCTGLLSVSIPNSVSDLGGYAFSGCTGLTSVIIPNSVTYLGSYAFYGCSNITTLVIGDGVTSVNYGTFSDCSSLENLTIGASVNRILSGSFTGCKNIKTLAWNSKNCTSKEGLSFSNLEFVTIGEEVEELPANFVKGSKITEVIIPNNVKSIPNSAFKDCIYLTSVSIGSLVNIISENAFSGCSLLVSVTCWALTPPTISSSTFNGTSPYMIVFVLPEVLESFKSNDLWKQYNIEPIQGRTKLIVNMPVNADISQYADMKLAISSTSGDNTLHYTITDKLNYTFNVDNNSIWNAILTNQYDDEFGKIENVQVGDGDVSVTFASLKKPQTVTLTVKTSAGQDVTEQASISWSDESGELLKQGKQIAGLLAGRKLAYSVKLPQELATAYSLPTNMTYTVKEGDNNVVCQLIDIAQTQLIGKVMEATTNQPLCGASISATQTFAGGNTKTLTATADNQGVYSLGGMSVPTTMTFAAPGYISQTLDCDTLMTGGNITMPDVTLQPITGAVVNVNLTYTPAHAEDGTPEVQNWYNDYNNVDYEVYNKTTNQAITNISVQYPQIVLMEDVNDGDVLELTAYSRKDAFSPVKITVTIAEQKATATINIVEQGKITATFKNNSNSTITGSLYNANGKLIKTKDYNNGALTFADLADGNYKLVTMGKSELFNTIYDLEQFAAVGLIEGDDYTQNDVQVKSGIISTIIIDEVPFFDESKLYYTGDNTSFTVNNPNIVVGNYLTFRAQVDFKEEYIDKISDVQLIIDLPESSPLYEGSVLVGNIAGTYTLSGNRITIPLLNYDDIVRFCAIPTKAGDYGPSAFVKFKLKDNNSYVTQPIGLVIFTAQNLSILLPRIVNKTAIYVSGTAIGKCDVFIYDNDVLIGQTKSFDDGKWRSKCELYKPYNLSNHYIHAEIISEHGLEMKTETAMCTYDKNAIMISKVCMLNGDQTCVFDYQDPNKSILSYTHRSSFFTFLIDFTNNDTALVKNVVLYVKTTNKEWSHLNTTYDPNKNCWIASGSFPLNALPINVSVDYICTTESELDWSPFEYLNSEIQQAVSDQNNAISSSEETIGSLLEKIDDQSLTQEELEELLSSLYSRLGIIEGITNPEDSILIENIRYFTGAEKYKAVDDEIDRRDPSPSEEVNVVLEDMENPCNVSIPKTEIDGKVIPEIDLNRPPLTNDSILPPKIPEILEDTKVLYGGISMDIGEIIPKPEDSDDAFQEWCNEAILTVGDYLSVGTNALSSIMNLLGVVQNYLDKDLTRHEMDLKFWRELSRQLNPANADEKESLKKVLDRINVSNRNVARTKILASSLRTANNVLSGAASFMGGWSIGTDIREGSMTVQRWNKLINQIYECDNTSVGYNLAQKAEEHKNWIKSRYISKGLLDFSSTCLGIAGVAGKASGVAFVPGLMLTLSSAAISSAVVCWGSQFKKTDKDNWYSIIKIYNELDCLPPPEYDDGDYPKGERYPRDIYRICIDPSGFVYEGVPSNRLEGVTATCYYKETVEDMYGDTHEEVVLWDAEQYGQENPLLTDENGYYRWDVPIGMWQVKYEKAGYETTYSDWLPVPPPQLDVNIGMVQMRQPEVIKAHAYPKAVELEFDKFMIPETLTTDNITVSVNGTAVSGNIELLNAEKDDPLAITSIRRAPGTGLTFASRVRFNANQPFNADQVTLHVKQDVKSYADLQMNEDYEVTLPIEYEMEKIVADSTLIVRYGDSRALTVTVMPAMASKGKTLNVRTTSPMIISTDAESYTLDNNGQAIVTVYGDLPGMGSLLFGIDGYDLSAATLVNVKMESEMTVATPTASIASGSEVEKGTEVYLYCKTEGATIYYTLDGSCPCDNTSVRKVYDGRPIIINANVTIKAMATAPDLYDSDVATFVYRVKSDLRGDVNNDGEVNIADVNALIDIILGCAVDEDTRSRADVNGDSEVNIADINALIDIILSSSNRMRMKVNCSDLLHMDDVTMRPGDVRTINVTLDDANSYSAMQCDIALPAGLTLVDISSVDGHISKADGLDESTMRAVNYSMDKRSFSGDGFPVMSLTVLADAALGTESEIKLTNVVLADAANKAWRAEDCTARVSNATGINDLTACVDRVWVEGNTLCIETRQDGVARIATINGVTYDLGVKAGVNRYDLDAGVYVVVINGKGHKIAVK